MYVIKAASGNIYPVEKCVYRIGAATGGGYKLTHLQLLQTTFLKILEFLLEGLEQDQHLE